MVKYLGSKRALLPWISETVLTVHHTEPLKQVVDLFSGTSRVGHALKRLGFYVVANDLMTYAHVLAQALIQADARHYPPAQLQEILQRLEALQGQEGWFSQTYCHEARFFQPKNGARIERIRQAIESEAAHDPLLRAILLSSLMLAADRVDSTTGVQMAYLKRWAPRAYLDLRLEVPQLLPGGGQALQADALEIAGQLEGDLFYLDPPYNQHSYLGNYHLWETLVLWDQPSTYGVAQKRQDVQERKSPFNSKREAKKAMQHLLAKLKTRHLVVSFNNEGFLSCDDISGLLKDWGFVSMLSRPHTRYVGARIGIYSPKGEKVGQVSHTTNHEYLFIATHSRKVHQRIQSQLLPAVS